MANKWNKGSYTVTYVSPEEDHERMRQLGDASRYEASQKAIQNMRSIADHPSVKAQKNFEQNDRTLAQRRTELQQQNAKNNLQAVQSVMKQTGAGAYAYTPYEAKTLAGGNTRTAAVGNMISSLSQNRAISNRYKYQTMTSEEAGAQYNKNKEKLAQLKGAKDEDSKLRVSQLKEENKKLIARVLTAKEEEAAKEQEENLSKPSSYWKDLAQQYMEEMQRYKGEDATADLYDYDIGDPLSAQQRAAASSKRGNLAQASKNYDKAREYYYYTKGAEDWNSLGGALQDEALEAAALKGGIRDSLSRDNVATGRDIPGMEEASAEDARIARIRKDLERAGYDADRILEYAERQYNAQEMSSAMERMQNFSTGSVAGGILGTAATYGTNLLTGISSADQIIQRITRNDGTIEGYTPIDINTAAGTFAQATSKTRAAVAEKIGETSQIGSFFYNVANSAVDSALNTAIAKATFGGMLADPAALAGDLGGAAQQAAYEHLAEALGPIVSAQMGTQIFANAFIESKEKGRTDDVALMDAITSSVIEGLTEKYSVEAILKNPSGLTWTALRNSFISEGSEEIASDLLDAIYDGLMHQDESDLQQEYNTYRQAGFSEKDALWHTVGGFLEQTLLDGLAGSLSGLGMSAASAGVDYVNNSQYYGQKYGADVKSLVDEALEVDPSNKLAKKIQGKLESGSKASNGQIYRLVQQTEQALAQGDLKKVQEAVASRLSELGETGEVEAVASAITRQEAGYELTNSEERAISRSRYAGRVLQELETGVNAETNQDAAWTGEIGTQKLNAEAFNRNIQEEAEQPEMQSAQAASSAVSASEESTVPRQTQQQKTSAAPSAEAAPQTQQAAKPTGGTQVQILSENRSGVMTGIKQSAAVKDGVVALVKDTETGQVSEHTLSDLRMGAKTARLANLSASFGPSAGAVYYLYQNGQNLSDYAKGAQFLYSVGQSSAAKEGAKTLSWAMNSALRENLTDFQAEQIFQAGRKDAQDSQKATKRPTRRAGSVQYEGNAQAEVKTKRQKAEIRALETMGKAFGIDFVLFSSETNEQGEYIGENGSYKDGIVRIDLHAGMRNTGEIARQSMLRTAAHELTHYIAEGNEAQFAELQSFIVEHLSELNEDWDGKSLDELVRSKMDRARTDLSYQEALEEVVCDSCEMMLQNSRVVQTLARENETLFQKLGHAITNFLLDLKEAFTGVQAQDVGAKQMLRYADELQKIWDDALLGAVHASQQQEQEQFNGSPRQAFDSIQETTNGVDAQNEVRHSLRDDERLMAAANYKNQQSGFISEQEMKDAEDARAQIREIMRDPRLQEALNLPQDIIGNTFLPDSSYGGTEENTTICPRTMGAEAFLDAVSEVVGRPLTVQEQVFVSQELQNLTDRPECLYCYVATDRKAYRAYLGSYIEQRNAVIRGYENGNTDTSRSGSLYKSFLNGRKDTDPMYARFKLWINTHKAGGAELRASDLTNMTKLTGDLSQSYGKALIPQIKDAMQYAQSASWAKKRSNYVAYNGHILKWTQNRINNLNSHYGLRMYSFSDFSPAFILENMQMVTDASVRGLKMLAYTKEMDFARIFAPTGMNINISAFGFERNGQVYENSMTGAPWAEAQELRKQYPNVGVTFVATNDTLVNWAMAQDWIDVVIPYHLVRTGAEVAKILSYTNYTAESGDLKIKEQWQKGDLASIPPTMHNNNKEQYLAALQANHLTPRFQRFLDNPNYMKLVNETRQTAQETDAVRPVFDVEHAKKSLIGMIKDGGYYTPIGGSVDRMYEIASEIGQRIYDGGAKFSDRDSNGRKLSEAQQEYFKDSQVRDEDGNLLVMYHGTANGGDFTVFQGNKLSNYARTSQLGQGFYFTNVKKEARAYMKNVNIYGKVSKGSNPYLHEVYLDIRNPFRVGVDTLNLDDAKAVYMDGNHEYFFNNTIPFELNNKKMDGKTLTKAEVQGMSKAERVSLFVDYLARFGAKRVLSEMVSAYTYDGQNLLLEAMQRRLGYDGIAQEYGEGKYQYVAFSSEQIKNVDNQSPTTNPDIRYSERDSNGRKLSEAQQAYFEDSEVRDDDGNLLVMYHATSKEFYQFDRDKLGMHTLKNASDAAFAATSLIGHWFNSQDVRKKTGTSIAVESYINIKHPYIATLDGLADEILDMADDPQQAIDDFDDGKYDELEVAASRFVGWLRNYGYDGVYIEHDREFGGVSVVILDSEQAKLTTNKNPTADPDIRYSERERAYDYDTLVKKPDMEVTEVSEHVPETRAEIIAQAKKNAAEIGTYDSKTGSVSVYVKDIGTDVLLGTNGLKHGLDRRTSENAGVTLKAGEILQNSIRINELTPEHADADASYVLIGAAKNAENDLYIVRSVVNRFSNEVTSMDVLYALNAKKENQLRSMRPGFQGPVTGSTLSISSLLEYVNRYFPDVLPESVLRHFGRDARPDGKLGSSALYSERDPMGDRIEALREQLPKTRALAKHMEKKLAEYLAKDPNSESTKQYQQNYQQVLQTVQQREAELQQLRDERAARVDARLTQMVERYGAIAPGENPARAVQVPKRTADGNRVSQTVRTALEAGVTTDEAAQDIRAKIEAGGFSYAPITDQEASGRAEETIRKKGYQKALSDWNVAMRTQKVGKDEVALGFSLYNQAVSAGDTKTAVEVLTDLSNRVREGAQMVQAVRMLKKLSPEHQLYATKLGIEQLQESLQSRYGDRAPQLSMDNALVQNLLQAKTQEEKEAAQEALYRNIASQLPNTWIDKWNAWRYLCMLGNARTHVRNILGNAFFVPVRMAKDAVAMGLESGYSAITGKDIERTKGFVWFKDPLYQFAANDYENIADLITGGGKYKDAMSEIEGMKSAFGETGAWKYLSRVSDFNSYWLDREDVWFARPAYAQALSGYLKANGISQQQFEASQEIQDKARAYAVQEAQRATYRDYNAFSDFIAKIGRKGNTNNKAEKVANTLMEGVLPFRRTPANILARGVEYSPIGLAQGVKQMLVDVRKGSMTPAQALDRIAAGLTGTGLVALGALLTAQGILTPPDDDDDKQAGFDDLRGKQSYSLHIGNRYISVDWLAPEAIPVFVGANLTKLLQDSGDGNSFLKSFYSALSGLSEPMLEMSMLSSLQDVIDNVSYSDSKLMAILSTAATNYLTQALPTLAGQIERITETERETTFASEDSPLTKDLQYILAKAMNKTPGDFQQIPYIDAWGRHEETGNIVQRALNNLVNPAYISKEQTEAFEDELQRLYDLGYSDILPQRTKQSQKVEGETLTQEEYVRYAETKGSKQYKAVKGIIESSWYAGLSDAAKAELVRDAYEYATGIAKREVNQQAEVSNWILDTQSAVKAGGSLPDLLHDRLDETVLDFQEQYPQYADLSDKQIRGFVNDCEPAGVSVELFYEVANACSGFEADKDGDGKTISGSKKQKVVDYIDALNLDYDQKAAIWDALKGTWADKDTPWEYR